MTILYTSGCIFRDNNEKEKIDGNLDTYIELKIENVTIKEDNNVYLRQLSFNLSFNNENDVQNYTDWEKYNNYKRPIVVECEFNNNYSFNIFCYNISSNGNSSGFKVAGERNYVRGSVYFTGNRLDINLDETVEHFCEIQYNHRFDTDNSASIIASGYDGSIRIMFEPTSPPPA